MVSKGICPECGKEKELINHHISYDPEITQNICRSCHNSIVWSGKHAVKPGAVKNKTKRLPITIGLDGRLIIPKFMREALGLPENQKYPLWIEAEPNMDECKQLVIWKG